MLIAQSLDDRYHSVEEIYGVLDSLDQIQEISDFYHLDTIGYSTQGKYSNSCCSNIR